MEKTKKNDDSDQVKEQVGAGAQQCGKIIEIPEAEYIRLQQEAAQAKENWDKYLRLHADVENTRKRWERDRQEIIRFANEGLLADLLNINDDLERTLRLSQEKHEDFTAFLKGVEMIIGHLHDLLRKNGIRSIEAQGKEFDPNMHEALMQIEKTDVPENTIVEELQKGYMMDNHVLRTAKVKVARRPTESGGSECGTKQA
jgi:molecular chaperone GrpE